MSSNRRLWAGLTVGALLAGASLADAVVDLATLQVLPQRGQSPDRARRDRYECHNWAVAQSGVVPRREPADEDAQLERAQRIDRVISGATIGAGIGGLVRTVQGKNPSHGVLAGAAAGAAVAAATGRAAAGTEEDQASNHYLRALSACLEGRGYTVAVPGDEALAASTPAPRAAAL